MRRLLELIEIFWKNACNKQMVRLFKSKKNGRDNGND